MEISPRRACEDLVALTKHVKVTISILAEQYGLTHIQLFVLDAINHGGMTMGRVANNLHCDASNITGIIDRLVAMGLVDRHENEHDRRIKELRLTEAGQELFAKITNALPEALGCTKLHPEDRAVLRRLTDRLV